MQIKIQVLTTDRYSGSLSLTFPMLVNRERLLKKGVRVKFSYSLKDLCGGDIIFIDSKFFRDWWQEREAEVYNLLAGMKARAGAVLWFDTTDSTGTPQFKVMPYVDGYYKNQLLRHKELYLNKFHGGRLISEYYNKKFGVVEREDAFVANPLTERSHLDKLYISWNSSLNDYGYFFGNYSLGSKARSKLARLFPYMLNAYTARFMKVDGHRPLSVTARIGSSHLGGFVTFHRGRLREELEKISVNTAPVGRRAYYRELKLAKICVSPFGWGEVCYRDFEAILCGALLVKPDMGHVETWPDLYRDNETYIKCAWGFSDLREKIEGLLSSPGRIREIAAGAQKEYGYYLFGRGRDEFCDRIRQIAERHLL